MKSTTMAVEFWYPEIKLRQERDAGGCEAGVNPSHLLNWSLGSFKFGAVFGGPARTVRMRCQLGW